MTSAHLNVNVSVTQRERTVEVDLAVAVLVSLVDHVDNLLVRQVVAQVHQYVLQLVGVDRARAVAVKDWNTRVAVNTGTLGVKVRLERRGSIKIKD